MSAEQFLALGGIAVAAIGLFKVWQGSSKTSALLTRAIPMLEIQVAQYEVNPNMPKVINEIVNQLKTDSGSSLRDQTNRLEKSANDNAVALDNFRIALEAQKEVAEQDRTLNRHQAQNMIVKFDQIWTQMQTMIQNQEKVAANLVLANTKVEGVASDLAASHERADAIQKGPPSGKSGEAADAAAQSSKTDDEILGKAKE